MRLTTIIAAAALVCGAGCSPDGTSPGKSTLRQTRMMMGTVVTVEASGEKEDQIKDALEAAWAEMGRLEALLSRYNGASEVNRINAAEPGQPVLVSPETAELLARARRIGELTEGGFDITVGPLLDLWGFYPTVDGRLPDRGEIAEVRNRTGWSAFTLDEEAGIVTVLVEGVELDLAGMAKGFIADRGAAALRRAGITDGLINAGGDIACLGEKPGGGPWRIGLEDPRREGELLLVLEAADEGVATSGDYRNFFIRRRRRYSHIVDPRTGQPAESGVIEVSVIAPDCATADGLATGIFVIGLEKGMALLEQLPETDGVIVTLEKGEPRAWLSTGLDKEPQ